MNYLGSCLTDEEKYFYQEKCQSYISPTVHFSDVYYHGKKPQIGTHNRSKKEKESQWTCSDSTCDSTYVC